MSRLLTILFIILTTFGCRPTDKKTGLEKIIFHSTGCFGSCPTYHLQLNNDKSFKLFAESVLKRDTVSLNILGKADTTKMGYFIGQSDDTLFQQITTELATLGLDTINFDGPSYTDGSSITLIIYYDGKRRYLQSYFPTPKADKLISSLYNVCESSPKKRSNEKFKIEEGSIFERVRRFFKHY